VRQDKVVKWWSAGNMQKASQQNDGNFASDQYSTPIG